MVKTSEKPLLISEIFYSIQGEAPNLGMPAWFIRTAGCNFRCNFCDTKYAWKTTKVMTPKTILNQLTNNCKNVIITGGEPLLQYEALLPLFQLLKTNGYNIYVETNGYYYYDVLLPFAQFTVSPKLQYLNTKYFTSLRKWVTSCVLKFVVGNKQEFYQAVKLCKKLQPKREVYFMPKCKDEQTHKETLLQLTEWVKKEAPFIRVTPRLQVYLYNGKRGF